MADKANVENGHNPVPISGGPLIIALTSLRNTEATLRWYGAQWVLTLNATALVGLAYRLISSHIHVELYWLVIGCAIVAFLNFVWYHTLRRDGKLFAFWNEKIAEHERVNGIEGNIQVFTSPEYQKLANARNRLQRNLERVTVVLIYVWTLLALVIYMYTFVE